MKTRKLFYFLIFLIFSAQLSAQKGMINNGAVLTVGEGAVININGGSNASFMNTTYSNYHGTIDLDGKIKLQGNWSNNTTNGSGFINQNSLGTVIFDGSTQQSIGGLTTTTFENISLQNPAGLILAIETSVSNNLDITNGLINLNSNDFILETDATISSGTVFSSSRMMLLSGSGQIKKKVSGVGTYLFPLGTASEYSPVTLSFSSGSFSDAQINISLTDTKHPDNESPTNFLSKYWQVSQTGISDFSCQITCQYADTDIHGSENLLYGRKWDGTKWLRLQQASNNAFSGTVTSFSDFTAGEYFAYAPVVAQIPNQTINEGETFTTISLDDYVSDTDHSDNEISWTSSGASQLSVTINNNRTAAITIPHNDWYGSETIQFTATDPDNLSDTNSAVFSVTNVNDAPVILSDIPAQNVKIGKTLSLDLNNYESDIDNTDEQLTWSFEITNPNVDGDMDWNGEITETQAGSDIFNFAPLNHDFTGKIEVTAQLSDGNKTTTQTGILIDWLPNNPPVITLSQTSFSHSEDNNIVLILTDDNKDDEEDNDADLTWSIMNFDNGIATVDGNTITFAPNTDFAQTQNVTLKLTDSHGGSDMIEISLTWLPVNDAPFISPAIANKTSKIGKIFSLDLNNYENDVDNSDAGLNWSIEIINGNVDGDIDWNGSLNETSTGSDIFNFDPQNYNFTGKIEIKATLSDGELTDSQEQITIDWLDNSMPVISLDQTSYTSTEEHNLVLQLSDQNKDDNEDENNHLTWSIEGFQNGLVTVEGNTITFTPDENFAQSETVTLILTDSHGGTDSKDLTLSWQPVNDKPVISPAIANQSVPIGETLNLDLNNNENDVDNDDMQLNWTIEITNSNVDGDMEWQGSFWENGTGSDSFTFDPQNVNFSGKIEIKATLSDGSLSAQQENILIDWTSNSPPTITLDQTSFSSTEDFDLLVNLTDDNKSDNEDPDNLLVWSIENFDNGDVLVDGNTIRFTPLPDFDGSETVLLVLTDSHGGSSQKQITLSWTPVNDAPGISPVINDKSANIGRIATLDLNNHESDIDNVDSELFWTLEITNPDVDGDMTWNGTFNETAQGSDKFNFDPQNHNFTGKIEVKATLSDGNETVSQNGILIDWLPNNPPVITLDQTTFTSTEDHVLVISLTDDNKDDTEDSDDALNWSISDFENGDVQISGNVITLIPVENFDQSETVTLKLEDSNGGSDTEQITVQWSPVNDAPEISPIIGNMTALIGKKLTIDLNANENDVDNTDLELNWELSITNANVDGDMEWTGQFSETQTGSDVFDFEPLNNDFSGKIEIKATLSDGNLSSSQNNIFLDWKQNTPPVITLEQTAFSSTEDELLVIELSDDNKSDDEDADENLVWSVENFENGTVQVDGNTITLSPDADFNGTETATLVLTDMNNGTDTKEISLNWQPVNDAPYISPPLANMESHIGKILTVNLNAYENDIDNNDVDLNWAFEISNADVDENMVWNGQIVETQTGSDIFLFDPQQHDYSGKIEVQARLSDGEKTAVQSQIYFDWLENNPPVITLDQTAYSISEDNEIVIQLSGENKSDAEDADSELLWSIAGFNNGTAQVNGNTLAFSPNENFTGTVDATLILTDTHGGNDSKLLSLTWQPMNDAPEISQTISGKTSIIGRNATLNLNDFEYDIDNTDTELTWTIEVTNPDVDGDMEWQGSITETATGSDIFDFQPLNNSFSGKIEVKATLSDGELTAVQSGIVFDWLPNNPPVISISQFTYIADEDNPITIELSDENKSDAEDTDEALIWSISSFDNGMVNVDGNTITVTPTDNFAQSDDVTLELTDSHGGTAYEQLSLIWLPKNDAPEISPPVAGGSIFCGEPFTLDLNNHENDVDNTDIELSWTLSVNQKNVDGDMEWSGEISQTNPGSDIFILDPKNPAFSGKIEIKATLSDSKTAVSQDGIFIDWTENTPPVITLDQTTFYGTEDKALTISLSDENKSDAENADEFLTWSIENLNHGSSQVNGNTITIEPAADFDATETVSLVLTDQNLGTDAVEISLVWQPVNDAPQIVDDIPSQTISKGQVLTLDLNGFESDIDNTDEQLLWSVEITNDNVDGDMAWNGQVTETQTGSDIFTFAPQDDAFSGKIEIKAILSDGQGAAEQSNIILDWTQNNAPAISLEQTSFSGTEDHDLVINLTDENKSDAEDDDNLMTWSIENFENGTFNVNGNTITLTPNPDFDQSETILLVLFDSDGGKTSREINVAWQPVNDAPVVSDIGGQEIFRSSEFAPINLDDYVNDDNTAAVDILWSASTSQNITVTIIDRVAYLEVADNEWLGSETIIFTATDEGGLSDYNDAVFTVKDAGTGIANETANIDVKVYPNPSDGMVNLEIRNQNKETVLLEIITMQGQLIVRKELNAGASEFVERVDMSRYASGIYCVKMTTGQHQVIKKVVIR